MATAPNAAIDPPLELLKEYWEAIVADEIATMAASPDGDEGWDEVDKTLERLSVAHHKLVQHARRSL